MRGAELCYRWLVLICMMCHELPEPPRATRIRTVLCRIQIVRGRWSNPALEYRMAGFAIGVSPNAASSHTFVVSRGTVSSYVGFRANGALPGVHPSMTCLWARLFQEANVGWPGVGMGPRTGSR